MTSTLSHESAAGARAIGLAWLLRLRTASVVGVLVLVGVVHGLVGVNLPLTPLLLLIGVWLASNVVAVVATRRSTDVPDHTLAGLLGLDALFLTGVFYLTGGPANPFSFFFLVHLSLAALALPPRWAWALAVWSTALFGLLFLDHQPLVMHAGPHDGHAGHADHAAATHDMQQHLRGMWIAFAAAAAYILTFTTRLARALTGWRAELAEAREQVARSERLASLATLAAGAAHELATPLSTIALVAEELGRTLDRVSVDEGVRDDVRLVRSEVRRCRNILDQLRVRAGDPAGEAAVPTDPRDLVDKALHGLSEHERARVQRRDTSGTERPLLFVASLAQALEGVVRNALEASAEGEAVEITTTCDADGLHVAVRDRGAGMSAEVAARAGEPFFTTKGARGMGLGVFLARSIAQRHGGHLGIESRPDQGTTVTFHLPSTVRPA